MTTFQSANHIHFVGIKGVGMTALALAAQDLGKGVSGSDVDADFVTAEVINTRHLTVKSGFSDANIPPHTDLVVYSGANGGQNNPEVIAAHNRNLEVISHAQAVSQAMEGKISISICGVGGKTSTAAMLANILEYANLKPSFLIGVGKVLNLQVPGRMSQGKHIVVEADEYAVSPGLDNSPRFHFQYPNIIICTNIAYDHPDIYSSLDATKAAFQEFFSHLPDDGLLIANGDSKPLCELNLNAKTIFFGQESVNEWQIADSFIGQGKQLLTIKHGSETFNMMLTVPGIFSAKNALAAYIAAKNLGVPHQTILEGLQLFRGSKRRFEKIGEANEIVYYDDYAHHPSEVKATLKAAKEWLPLYNLVAVFQPHTYSRTKALFSEFTHCFNHADEIIITDIYGAREDNDPSINSEMLVAEVSKTHPNVKYVKSAELENYLKSHLKSYDALFTIGAGDIYKLHNKLINPN